jgi:transposase
LARLVRKRKKKGSSQEGMSPSDPDARITKMKDGRTSGALPAVTLQPVNEGDATTIHRTLAEAQAAALEVNERGVEEVMADSLTAMLRSGSAKFCS